VTSSGPTAPPPGTALPSYPEGVPLDVHDDTSSTRERVLFVLGCVAVGAIASLPAGWLWARLADPPTATVTSNGLKFGELEFDQVVGVTMWFMFIGLAFGLVLGAAVGWMGRRHGAVTVIAVLGLCLAGTGLTMVWGAHLFGPDNAINMVDLFTSSARSPLHDAGVGDVLSSELAVRSSVAYLGWPIGGLLGAILGIFGWPKPAKPAWMPAPSSTLSVQ
jgi:hypothetical protein